MDKRLIQLTNSEGEHTGLYITSRTDVENFQSNFDTAATLYSDQDEADSWLEEHKNIQRVFAEEVSVDFD